MVSRPPPPRPSSAAPMPASRNSASNDDLGHSVQRRPPPPKPMARPRSVALDNLSTRVKEDEGTGASSPATMKKKKNLIGIQVLPLPVMTPKDAEASKPDEGNETPGEFSGPAEPPRPAVRARPLPPPRTADKPGVSPHSKPMKAFPLESVQTTDTDQTDDQKAEAQTDTMSMGVQVFPMPDQMGRMGMSSSMLDITHGASRNHMEEENDLPTTEESNPPAQITRKRPTIIRASKSLSNLTAPEHFTFTSQENHEPPKLQQELDIARAGPPPKLTPKRPTIIRPPTPKTQATSPRQEERHIRADESNTNMEHVTTVKSEIISPGFAGSSSKLPDKPPTSPEFADTSTKLSDKPPTSPGFADTSPKLPNKPPASPGFAATSPKLPDKPPASPGFAATSPKLPDKPPASPGFAERSPKIPDKPPASPGFVDTSSKLPGKPPREIKSLDVHKVNGQSNESVIAEAIASRKPLLNVEKDIQKKGIRSAMVNADDDIVSTKHAEKPQSESVITKHVSENNTQESASFLTKVKLTSPASEHQSHTTQEPAQVEFSGLIRPKLRSTTNRPVSHSVDGSEQELQSIQENNVRTSTEAGNKDNEIAQIKEQIGGKHSAATDVQAQVKSQSSEFQPAHKPAPVPAKKVPPPVKAKPPALRPKPQVGRRPRSISIPITPGPMKSHRMSESGIDDHHSKRSSVDVESHSQKYVLSAALRAPEKHDDIAQEQPVKMVWGSRTSPPKMKLRPGVRLAQQNQMRSEAKGEAVLPSGGKSALPPKPTIKPAMIKAHMTPYLEGESEQATSPNMFALHVDVESDPAMRMSPSPSPASSTGSDFQTQSSMSRCTSLPVLPVQQKRPPPPAIRPKPAISPKGRKPAVSPKGANTAVPSIYSLIQHQVTRHGEGGATGVDCSGDRDIAENLANELKEEDLMKDHSPRSIYNVIKDQVSRSPSRSPAASPRGSPSQGSPAKTTPPKVAPKRLSYIAQSPVSPDYGVSSQAVSYALADSDVQPTDTQDDSFAAHDIDMVKTPSQPPSVIVVGTPNRPPPVTVVNTPNRPRPVTVVDTPNRPPPVTVSNTTRRPPVTMQEENTHENVQHEKSQEELKNVQSKVECVSTLGADAESEPQYGTVWPAHETKPPQQSERIPPQTSSGNPTDTQESATPRPEATEGQLHDGFSILDPLDKKAASPAASSSISQSAILSENNTEVKTIFTDDVTEKKPSLRPPTAKARPPRPASGPVRPPAPQQTNKRSAC